MKKIILTICACLLFISGCNSNTTQEKDSKKTTVEKKDTKDENTGWKWDLLRENSAVKLGDTYVTYGQPLYDRRDSLAYVFFGKDKTEGKYNASYITIKSIVKDEEFQANSFEELETKYLVKDNEFLGSFFYGLFKGSVLEWNVKSKEKVTINEMEFLHLVADVEAYNTVDKSVKSPIYDKGVSTHAEGYFTLADKKDGSGKQMLMIIRGWRSDSSEEVQEKTKKVVAQVLDSLRIQK